MGFEGFSDTVEFNGFPACPLRQRGGLFAGNFAHDQAYGHGPGSVVEQIEEAMAGVLAGGEGVGDGPAIGIDGLSVAMLPMVQKYSMTHFTAYWGPAPWP